ncbi:MAG: hypothetical protein LC775_00305, partial [Acidobacteria bacterium]|nr:hypothetical protein [Acidobacteriota bacterium]
FNVPAAARRRHVEPDFQQKADPEIPRSRGGAGAVVAFAVLAAAPWAYGAVRRKPPGGAGGSRHFQRACRGRVGQNARWPAHRRERVWATDGDAIEIEDAARSPGHRPPGATMPARMSGSAADNDTNSRDASRWRTVRLGPGSASARHNCFTKSRYGEFLQRRGNDLCWSSISIS